MAHLERALDHDLAHIQKLLTTMAQHVQYMLKNSITALVERNTKLAEEIIQFDKEVDKLEIQVDQAIHEVIALRQPAAGDLRNLLAGIKINNDLERMGDYCESICRQAIKINKEPPLTEATETVDLARGVSQMLGDAIEAYTAKSIKLAKKTILADDKVDEMAHDIFDKLQKEMLRADKVISASALMLLVAKLERIGDQATNICEEVIFTITGDNIRHRSHAFAVGDEE